MSYRKEIITAAGTLCCAIGIGFVMQGSDSAKERYDANAGAPAVARQDMGTSVLLSVRDITLTSAEVDGGLAKTVVVPQPETKVTPVSAPLDLMPEPDKGVDVVAEPECDIEAKARAKAAAMVDLTLSAPCLSNERVTIHHGGMIFMQITDTKGNVNVTIPALAEQAVFIIAFSNGEGAVAQTQVEEFGRFDRIVLQWRGDTGFGIHALEYGASYGDERDVWVKNAGSVASAVTGDGGYMTLLGDPSIPDGIMAEVYTFPSGLAKRSGDVDLRVEVEVTEANCGSDVEAKAMQISAGTDARTRNLTLSIPECDATGSFLLLNNLFEDLKVAGS